MFRRQILNVVAFVITVGAASSALADKPETPSRVEGGKVVTVEEAKKLLDGKGALFVDTRSVVNFGKGRVPGAVTASYKEKSEPVPDFNAADDSFELEKLPKDKSAPVVFYSDGPTGWKSYKAAVLSVKAGHKNVMYMRSGMADWAAKNLPIER